MMGRLAMRLVTMLATAPGKISMIGKGAIIAGLTMIAAAAVAQAPNLERMDIVLRSIPESALLDLAYYVLTNLHRVRTGFPDLLVIYEFERFEFVEVKGPEDQLQPGQRIWFKALKRLGLPARVLKFKR